jgi:hypothetical protein
MKIEYTRGALGVALSALVSVAAFAQHEAQQMPSPATSASSASPAACAQSSQGVTRGIDALVARIDEARQTNDAATMRATVGDLQIALAQMKTELADCTALTESSGAGNMAAMDHSKMQMAPKPGAASGSGAAATGPKTAAPMTGMDHSKMATEKQAPAAGATPSKAPQAPSLLFALRTQPAPPRDGKNDFEVTVKDADGKPITDVEVSLEFSMPAMPSMKVPEVRLTSSSNGSYKGSANLGMAGDWDVTIKASRNGEQLDMKKMRLTAK